MIFFCFFVLYLNLYNFVDIADSPRVISRWRKVIRILSLQCFQSQEVIDDVNTTPDDDDVLAEQQLVHSGKADADRIAIRNLSKVYDNGKVAVDNLSIGVAPGECFGLLGINGEFNIENIDVRRNFRAFFLTHSCLDKTIF